VKTPLIGTTLLVVVATVARFPIDEIGVPVVVLVSTMLALFAIASNLPMDLGRIEGRIGTIILPILVLTLAHLIPKWSDKTYLPAFLAVCFGANQGRPSLLHFRPHPSKGRARFSRSEGRP